MASLKEIKGRIGSVKTTLKTTSAMKMVASAKLHKAQGAAERCSLYESQLHDILAAAGSCAPAMSAAAEERTPANAVALVALSSNSSLCGAFNGNVIKAAKAELARLRSKGVEIKLYAVGKKMAEAMAKEGLRSDRDYSHMAGNPNYAEASALAQELIGLYESGKVDEVILVYSHLVSTANQTPVVETYLPYTGSASGSEGRDMSDFIIEPSPAELLEELQPKVLRLKIYTMLLDCAAAEHAARTVAMQTATDNGESILAELTLEYNKGRQQKITSEILDLVGGSMQQ